MLLTSFKYLYILKTYICFKSMYFEKNSHYGKQTFWEKRYAEYVGCDLGTARSSTGTKTGPICATSFLSISSLTAKSSTLEPATLLSARTCMHRATRTSPASIFLKLSLRICSLNIEVLPISSPLSVPAVAFSRAWRCQKHEDSLRE
jgi:hypothetical protein